MKKYLQSLWDKAEKSNLENIFSLLEFNPDAIFLDCGCADGELTLRVASKIGTRSIYGVEIADDLISKAESKGIVVRKADLNNKLPFDDNAFDFVHANQVIEHLFDTDNFVSEIYRVLRRGGYAVVSTENLASWHNIFSLLFGWQPFSLTNISSSRLGIGNPIALHRGEEITFSSWQHIRVFAYRGLREIFESKGFKVEKIIGAGYYPLPNLLAKLDPRHAAFLTIKVRKA